MQERQTSYPKSRMHVLFLEGIHHDATAAFKQQGFPVESLQKSLGEEEIKQIIPDVFILGVRSKTQLSAPVFQNARKLLVVGAFCVGTEKIDLGAASGRGVAVFNDPLSNTRSVAELALAHSVELMRGVPEKNALMHQGIWNKSTKGSRELRGKTLGIIGYGRIGSQLSVLAESVGMNVVFYNTSEVLPMGNARRMDSMDEVLEAADVVSVHVSGRPENKNLFSASQFEAMRDGAIFIQLSRGMVVDIKSLAEYLKTGKLKGAAVDVFKEEPEDNDTPFRTDLQGIPNVILTPHIGGGTQEAQEDIARFVSGKLLNFINSGDTTSSVNYPEIRLSSQRESHRFLHLHRDVPGVLAQLNAILAESGINIIGQYQQTRNGLGYVIVDVDKDYNPSVIGKIKKISETLRFRVLY